MYIRIDSGHSPNKHLHLSTALHDTCCPAKDRYYMYEDNPGGFPLDNKPPSPYSPVTCRNMSLDHTLYHVPVVMINR